MNASLVVRIRRLAVAGMAIIGGMLAFGMAGIPLAAEPAAIEFLRVHAPQFRLEDVPLGGGRYVPMSVAEFDDLVARATATQVAGAVPRRPVPLATRVRMITRLDDHGDLVGRLVCTVSAETAAVATALPLGGLVPRSEAAPAGSTAAAAPITTLTTAVTSGLTTAPEAEPGVVFGGDAGSLWLAIPRAGAYDLGFACRPAGGVGDTYTLSLVPALETQIDLVLPTDVRPLVLGPAAREAVITPPAAGAGSAWRIDVGPAAAVDITLVSREQPAGLLRSWSDITIRHRDADIVIVVEPDADWQAGELVLEKQPGFVVAGIDAVAAAETKAELTWRDASDGRDIVVTVPAWLEGQRTPLHIRGVAPAADAIWRLPIVKPPAARWAGGGHVVRLAPTLVATAIELADCSVVTPQAASRWPLPPAAESPPAGPLFHVEQQAATATAELTVQPRTPTFDVARVTTVEISPAAVLGRAACDVRVVDGQAFEIVGRIATGWIIDSVEPLLLADGGGRRPLKGDELPLDWRTIRGPDGSMLRIGLPVAITPEAVLGLRITGHRPRIPVGTPFSTAEIDMVRLPGESADATLIDFKVGPEAVVEVDGEPAGWLRARGRLAPLVEEGTLRARIRGSDQASNREARVAQRRPPLDASVEVRLDVRDDLLIESFTFACRPEAGGIDAFVAHFSEPMGEPLDWSVLEPADVSIAVRRLETPGGLTGGPRNDAIAESWLIECTPAVSRPLMIRAVRTLPFVGGVPVPLAWLEGDTSPGGVVVLTATGPRPEFMSRRLRTLPAAAEDDVQGGVEGRSEFFYGPPVPAGDGLPAAELMPAAAGADARAWAWREQVSCWCDESGAVETESRFDVENQGRSSLTVSVPAGRVLERIIVDGASVAIDSTAASGTAQRISLPAAARRVELVVWTRALSDPRSGWWRVDPLGCSIDAPVLDRDIRLLVPPGLDVVAESPGFREVGRQESSWLRRLFGPPWALSSEVYADGDVGPAATAAIQTGFHARRFVTAADRAAGRGIVLVRRRLLGSFVILVAALAAAVTFQCQPRRPRLAFGICLAAALSALWAASPFDVVARVALWAALGGAVAAAVGPRLSRLIRRLVRILRAPSRGWAAAWLMPIGLIEIMGGGRAAAAEPFRVVITDAAEAPLALVPEPLYRLLADAAPPDTTGIRLTGCRVEAAEPPAVRGWRMILDLEADIGGSFVLDQSASQAVWRAPRPGDVPPGLRTVMDGPRLRLSAAAAGRFTVTLGVDPVVERRGEIVMTPLDVPAAPGAALVVVDASGRPVEPRPTDVQCDMAMHSDAAGDASSVAGPWRQAVPLAAGSPAPGFDIAGSRRVRVVRPATPRGRLASSLMAGGFTAGDTTASATIKIAAVNEVLWGLDACRVEATCDLDAGGEIIRSFIMAVDPRFTDIEAVADEPPRLTRVAADRLFVELLTPATGVARVRLVGTMPLVDPVGVFTIPALWPETAAESDCTTRLTAAAELDATVDPPLVAAPGTAPLPQRLAVRRRSQRALGSQNLLVDIAADRSILALRTQIDATAVALTQIPVDIPADAIVDRVSLVRIDQPGTVDLSWARPSPEAVTVVVQQPRLGQFRLDIDLRIAAPLPPRGRLPLARARLRGGAPLLVTWQTEPGLRLVVTPAGTDPATLLRSDTLLSTELFEGDAAPEYLLQAAGNAPPPAFPDAIAPVTLRSAVTDSRLERTEVVASLDGRGRMRGIVRFDLLTDQPVVRVRLPAGMRLFDVLVDGRAVPAVPRAANAWDVRLQDVDWPRALLVLFAGDLGSGFAVGEPVHVEAPVIEGLTGGDVWWTIEPPAGFALRIAEPARPLETMELEGTQAEVRQRLDGIFDRVLGATSALERERLQSLAAVRRVGANLAPESSWETALRGPARPAARRVGAFVTAGNDDGITLRAIRDFDSTAPGRALATVALLCAGGGLWFASRRGKQGD